MHTKTRTTILALLAFFLLAAFAPVCAGSDDDQWHFTSALYGPLPFMNGTLGVRGVEMDVDMNASDIMRNLKMGFFMFNQVKKGKWGAAADIVYFNMGTYTNSPHINLDFSQQMYTFAGSREIHPNVDLMFGVRYNVIKGQMYFFDRTILIPANTELKQSETWLDPIVGINCKVPLSKRAMFGLYTTVGGFGLGSKISLDLFPNLQFKLADHVWLGGGYRLLYNNRESGYEDGQIRQPDAFKFDMVEQSMVFGMVFRF